MSDFSLTEINERISRESTFVDDVKKALKEVIVGQEELVNRILIGMLANGHILLEGVPGLAKTLVVKSLSQLIDTKFQRIQFTPDMLPADLIGTLIYNQHTGKFDTRKGPIFTNIILADEINRAPSKVQSALLEAMQERQTTIGKETYLMDAPFLVLATQNPIEQEGTYPLPEAQTDRFMLKVRVDYPSIDEERLILRKAARTQIDTVLTPVVNQQQILKAQKVIDDIYVDQKVEEYVLNLVFSTRNPDQYELKDMEGLIEYGGSPRASINLILAAKSRAFLEHRGYVTPEDIRYIGADVLRHRIILTYEAEAEEITSEDIIRRLFETIEIP
ncbi:MAG TPA: MoxR family ATPase [Candidatus Marinimicrobia bacterium]|jgi:MoxR-like ATPase|nr:MoxR family ATPase [Candidatus Neomarinimicrobiota bacterium]MDP6261154.1 MoxR family ATPase [Candidatus Neomarinimicrobiota bacterium]MDP7127262.1 MoxR family ATPase [Candidatus Neomarinimicrobiota bacterium]MDP7337318.1 MoxR family ATPase [Candidatus Neomarinimicrobiota bacterium]MDP7474781.1 MoxR family ATPase [Candidatus Neomarinimicrobiota bacterium]|tara:strand:- start:7669 stop:8664 length:996 start_codon:yes stop_codon:yes gene_type:complete